MNDNKIEEWIKNAFENKVNTQPIFIKDYGFDNINKPFDVKINFINLRYLNKDFIPKSNNPIIVVNNTFNFQNSIKEHISKGFIFIHDKQSVENLIFAIVTKDIYKIKEVQSIVIEPINLETLLSFNKSDFQRFIVDRENILKVINEQYIRLDHEDLFYFLEIYYSKKILIASFAQRLFRLATLDFITSEKRIGTSLREILNTSSEVVTPKYIGIIGGTKKIYNTRVYDLNVNQKEREIRIDIVKKLFTLNLKELDVKTIAKVTDLPLKIVEKLYQMAYLK
ncbi:hypothetical protein [Aliarcobacter cryaerophilus]|uniref:hypothetical protein n=1 Tax=Aliarcobacter cryaerophilus TaxID=28198 RepID=UPI0021B29E60|nr:hypothetical protein [Aliarcobacter cryaerophilus]MCT7506982.1 hypothetical protein [Aliarcobacter cryaerophilus]